MFRKAVGLMAVSVMAFAFSASAVVVQGKISSDSANGSALAGATVIIAPLFGTGTADTVISAATTGLYSFANVTAGVYGITVSKTGFVTKTENVNIINANDTVNVFLVASTSGKVIGKISVDSLTGAAMAGAKVVLTRRTGMGGTIAVIDSMVTLADGKYSFVNVPTTATGTTSFSVVVSKTGYASKTANAVLTGTATDTVNVFLASVQYGMVVGKISADSLTGAALSGVKVVLSTRANGGGGSTPIDSMVTIADGKYAFNSVVSGRYSIAASKTGYASKTGLAEVATTLTDTVNLFLAPVQQGSIVVYVGKATDSTAIAGAAVTVTTAGGMGGTTLSGTSAAGGFVTFSPVATGNYTISVSAAGYSARGGLTATVTANTNDTVKAYLTASSQPTKLVKGVVTDSVGGAPLANVLVSIRVFGGSGMITITDSTNASGAYLIVGIPAGSTIVTLTASKTGYVAYTNATLSTTADTTLFNFKMRAAAVGVGSVARAVVAGNPLVMMQGSGFVLSGISGPFRLTVVGLDGKAVYDANVNAGTRNIAVPSRSLVRGSMLIATVTQNGAVYRSTLLVR